MARWCSTIAPLITVEQHQSDRAHRHQPTQQNGRDQPSLGSCPQPVAAQSADQVVDVAMPTLVAQGHRLQEGQWFQLVRQPRHGGHRRPADEYRNDRRRTGKRSHQLGTDVVGLVSQARLAVDTGSGQPPGPNHCQRGVRTAQRGVDSIGEVLSRLHGDDVLKDVVLAETSRQCITQTASPRRGILSTITEKIRITALSTMTVASPATLQTPDRRMKPNPDGSCRGGPEIVRAV